MSERFETTLYKGAKYIRFLSFSFLFRNNTTDKYKNILTNFCNTLCWTDVSFHQTLEDSVLQRTGVFTNVCRSWIKGAFVLEVLLGLTWAFGLAFVSQQTVVFAYIFTIVNSLQGTFIFVFHCVMNEKVTSSFLCLSLSVCLCV